MLPFLVWPKMYFLNVVGLFSGENEEAFISKQL